MTRDALTADPQYAPLWPLALAAWFDGRLEPAELAALAAQLAPLEAEIPGSSAALAPWLDAGAPPTAGELLALARRVRDRAQDGGASAASLPDLAASFAAGSPGPGLQAAAAALAARIDYPRSDLAAHLEAGQPVAVTPRESAYNIDDDALEAWLEGSLATARRTVRAMLEEPLFRLPGELSRPEYRAQVTRWLLELSRRGYGALAYPGVTGRESDMGAFLATFEALAAFDLSLVVKFGVQFGLFGGAIYFLGDDDQRARYLPDVAAGRLLGCFAMTELGHGSNVRDLLTTATYDPERGEWVLRTPVPAARKEWIGNAGADGHVAVVFAQLVAGGTGCGVHAFLVPIRDHAGAPLPGVTLEDCGHKMGLNGVDNGRITFADVRVPRSALLSRFAQVSAAGEYTSPIPSPTRRFFTMLGTLVGGRVAVAGAAITASKLALTLAVRYGLQRRQFGPASGPETLLLDYPSHQRRLMPLLAATYALHCAADEVRASFLAPDRRDRALETLAAGVKAHATWHTVRAIQACREACGGQGYLAANRFGALMDDTEVFCTFEGDNTVLLQLVARNVLTEFRETYLDGSMRGMAGLAGRTLSNLAARANPFVGWRWSDAHLRDREMQTAAFRYREEMRTAAAARDFARALKAAPDPFAAAQRCQRPLRELADAWVESRVLAAFRAAIPRAPAGLHDALDRLCDLYALSRIEADLAWFLEQGYVEPPKADAIHDAVDRLCAEVRADAAALVAAFAIPPGCADAPMLRPPA